MTAAAPAGGAVLSSPSSDCCLPLSGLREKVRFGHRHRIYVSVPPFKPHEKCKLVKIPNLKKHKSLTKGLTLSYFLGDRDLAFNAFLHSVSTF